MRLRSQPGQNTKERLLGLCFRGIGLVKTSTHMERARSVGSLEQALRRELEVSVPELAALGEAEATT